MPGFMTHYFFGVSTYKELPPHQLKKSIKDHIGVFCLGQQGPDIFLYHVKNAIGPANKNISTLIHEEKVSQFFYNYICVMESLKSPKAKDIARVYLSGVLGHYYLDSSAHPYIYNRANYIPGQSKHNQINFHIHGNMETYIDIYMLKLYKGKKPSSFHETRKLHLSKEEMKVLEYIISKTIQKTYYPTSKKNVEKKLFRQTYYSMKIATLFLHSTFGVRKKILQHLESIVLRHHLLSTTIATNHTVDTLDSLNLNHKQWKNPWDRSLVSRESFLDLYEKSKKNYRLALKELERFYVESNCHINSKMIHKLVDYIGDLSYHSGLSTRI